MESARLVLKPGRQRRLLAGHPWVYSGEVAEIQGQPEPGDLVAVVDAAGRWVGQGFYSPKSQICVRLLSRHPEPIDEEFFRRRIITALRRRSLFYPDERSVRLIFSEGDFLPGLIVDRYEDYLVCQFLTVGVDRRRDLWVKLLVEELSPRGILGRQDAPVREREGLPRGIELLYGSVPDRIKIRENGLPFWVDLRGGQKTGYFLDQKENRRQLRTLITPGMRVLDAFSHTGSFALHSLAYGAGEVVAVDISAEAVALARENERLLRDEGLVPASGSVRWETANAFDFLRELVRKDEVFDLCILDPPAFTKGRETLEGAWRGYKEINLRAIKLLRPGGFLVTCSCSYHMDFGLFLQVVQEAASDTRRMLQVVEYRSQAKDHPYLLSVPETAYLKCLIAQVF
ncbi:MAG: class I SAM-dependent rRNA methyltransferase [Limnochordales bacterium]|nr:class I SAM-dependent rRNA methyltransferase [Limnochordales bacterium]